MKNAEVEREVAGTATEIGHEQIWLPPRTEEWQRLLDGDVGGEGDPGFEECLKLARDFVARVPEPECAKETAREYLKIYDRVARQKMCLKNLRSRSTFYKYKAAVQNVSKKRLKFLLDAYDSGKMADGDRIFLRETIMVLSSAGILDRVYGCTIERPIPRKSKRRSLKIRKWRERMWWACREESKYKPALAVLHLAGVRPRELQNGIAVAVDEEDGKMCIYIKGVKNSKSGDSGQPWREITFQSRYVEFGTPQHYLQQLAFFSDGCVEVKAHAKRLNDFVRRLANKVFGEKKHSISPYSYRHQFCADLKGGDGFPKMSIAQAMGHQSERTQKQYGSAKQSTGGSGIIDVKAAKKVRQHRGARQFPREQATERMSRN